MAHDQDCRAIYENCMWIPENKTKAGREYVWGCVCVYV